MQQEALEQIVQIWTNHEVELDGKYWSMPKRQVCPKPLQKPHPEIWWATTSPEGHIETGEKGLNLLSFTIGVGPDILGERIAGYRDGLTRAKPVAQQPGGKVGAFTMVHCAPTTEEAHANAKESFEWYVTKNGELIEQVSSWMATLGKDLGTYAYIKDLADAGREAAESAPADAPPVFDALDGINAFIAGDPETCIEKAKAYEAAGCDLLMCLVNPYNIEHEKVMQCIELLGKEVIPAFADGGS
jgi:alkanesulfonate monooxygenase SsuD/methylene tetrahydromethanopterin reductase-like flavin-dependent oxidoreductase (luciferase family)